MKNYRLFLLVQIVVILLYLTGCAGPNRENSDVTFRIQPDSVLNVSRIEVIINGKFIEIEPTAYGLHTVVAKNDYYKFQIPDNALAACTGTHANLSYVYYVVYATKEYNVYLGQFNMVQATAVHYNYGIVKSVPE